jgi:hypothetical protein
MTPYRIVPLSTFRRKSAEYAHWVTYRGGRVWLAKHGRLIGALVSMGEVDKLEAFEGRGLSEQRRKLEADYVRWKRLKAAGHLRAEWSWEAQAPDEETVQALLAAELDVVRAESDKAWDRKRRARVGLGADEEVSDREIAEAQARGAWYE